MSIAPAGRIAAPKHAPRQHLRATHTIVCTSAARWPTLSASAPGIWKLAAGGL